MTGATLAIDATGGLCAAAVLSPDGALARWVEPMSRGHAERLFPVIDKALQQAGAQLADVSLVAAARGPGSFTGVRIGVAAARGLALASAAKAVGVDGFSVVAEDARAAGLRAARALVAFGKPPRFAVRLFRLDDAGAVALGPMRTPEADDGAVDVVIGPAAASAGDALGRPVDARFSDIDPGTIARLAVLGGPAVGPPTPLYLRPPDATPSQERRPKRLGQRPA